MYKESNMNRRKWKKWKTTMYKEKNMNRQKWNRRKETIYNAEEISIYNKSCICDENNNRSPGHVISSCSRH